MNNQAQFNQVPEADQEVSLWDILNFLKDGWRWLAGGLLLGLLCAVGYLIVTPKKYEAQALLQGAKVLSADLESSAQLIERLKFPTFYGSAELQACDIPADNQAMVLAKRINPVLLKHEYPPGELPIAE